MKDAINDVVKRVGNLPFVNTIKVNGTDTGTTFEAIDEEKSVIIKAILHEPVAELKGEFGINTLDVLNGLLNSPLYQNEDSFSVKRRTTETTSYPEEFIFKDANGEGGFIRLMEANLIPNAPRVIDMTWDVEFTPTKSNISGLNSLTSLFSTIDQFFSIKKKGTDLIAYVGEENSTNHRASIVFAQEVPGELKAELLIPTSQFIQILKMGDGYDVTVSLTARGALMIKFSTDHATYHYVMPSRRR